MKRAPRNFDSGSVDTSDRADIEAALDEHLRRVAFRNGKVACLFLVGFIGVLWPTDWIVFRGMTDVRHAATGVRVWTILVSLLTYAAMRTRFGPRHAIWFLGAGGSVVLFGIGYFLGGLGGPGVIWFHLAFPALTLSMLAPVRQGGRVLLVLGMTVALCAGGLLPYPAHWHEPLVFVMMSYVVSMAAMLVAVGHLAFRILRQSFYQSLALENLERLREEERTRIARELHDELGQELTAMNLTLALTQSRYANDPTCVSGNLGELDALLKRTHATTRNLVRELRPPMLEELGLLASLEWLARHTERSGVPCVLNADDVDDLPAATSAVAFRIVQEALTNVVRHSQARHVEVSLVTQPRQLAITVSDDGIGLPSGHARHGFGLRGMKERVTSLAGKLDVRARAGGGTTLAVTLPLRAREASA